MHVQPPYPIAIAKANTQLPQENINRRYQLRQELFTSPCFFTQPNFTLTTTPERYSDIYLIMYVAAMAFENMLVAKERSHIPTGDSPDVLIYNSSSFMKEFKLKFEDHS